MVGGGGREGRGGKGGGREGGGGGSTGTISALVLAYNGFIAQLIFTLQISKMSWEVKMDRLAGHLSLNF